MHYVKLKNTKNVASYMDEAYKAYHEAFPEYDHDDVTTIALEAGKAFMEV